MKNRKRWILPGLLAAGILLFGCAKLSNTEETVSTKNQPETKQEGTYVEKEKQGINDYELEDNKLLYGQDDPTSVVTMYLTVRQGNAAEHTNHTWTEVNTYSKYYYEDNDIPQYAVEAILQVGDENGPVQGEFGYGASVANATVQVRGQTSSRSSQKNFKVKIKDGQGMWREQRTLALNKHVGDGSRMRNKLAYDLMKEIPEMMSARTQFVHLYVKDETEGQETVFQDYGLFTQVEQINKRYLTNHGLDKNGQLYKINFFEFQRYEDAIKLATDEAYDKKAFEEHLEVKGSEDHTKLIEMLEAVNDYSKPIEEVVDRYFDEDNLLYWMAFQILIGNDDTNARNYYLYSPLNLNKWYVISWDNDGSLNRLQAQLMGNFTEGSWEDGISRYWGVTLYERMFKIKEYREKLTEAVRDLHENYLTADNVTDRVQQYQAVVKPFVYSMPDRTHAPLTPEQYDQVIDAMPKEVEENYQIYMESLNEPMPFYIGKVSAQDGQLRIGWDPSYDFDGEEIRYTVELAADYEFQQLIERRENVRIPEFTREALPPGQYFFRVRAQNESGFEQTAFDYYVTEYKKIFGTKCFYVLGDGRIEEVANGTESGG